MLVRAPAPRCVVTALGIAAIALAADRVVAQSTPVIGLITKTDTNPCRAEPEEHRHERRRGGDGGRVATRAHSGGVSGLSDAPARGVRACAGMR